MCSFHSAHNPILIPLQPSGIPAPCSSLNRQERETQECEKVGGNIVTPFCRLNFAVSFAFVYQRRRFQVTYSGIEYQTRKLSVPVFSHRFHWLAKKCWLNVICIRVLLICWDVLHHFTTKGPKGTSPTFFPSHYINLIYSEEPCWHVILKI